MTDQPTSGCACACLKVSYAPIDNGNGTHSELWRCNLCGAQFHRSQEPKMTETQAETETVVQRTKGTGYRNPAIGPEVPPVSVNESRPAYDAWLDRARPHHLEGGLHHYMAGYEDGHASGYQAGRASLAGELEEAKPELAEAHHAREYWRDELEAEKAAHQRARAHVQQLENERADEMAGNALIRKQLGARDNETMFGLAERIEAELTAARQARVIPSREALAQAMFEQTPGPTYMHWESTKSREFWYQMADAVLRLLAPTQDSPGASPEGEADAPTDASDRSVRTGRRRAASGSHDTAHEGAGSDARRHEPSGAPEVATRTEARAPAERKEVAGASSDPPVPLPQVLPAGTRTKDGTAALTDLRRGEFGSYWGKWDNEHSRANPDRDMHSAPSSIDWAHYRAQQARYVPSVGERAVFKK